MSAAGLTDRLMCFVYGNVIHGLSSLEVYDSTCLFFKKEKKTAIIDYINRNTCSIAIIENRDTNQISTLELWYNQKHMGPPLVSMFVCFLCHTSAHTADWQLTSVSSFNSIQCNAFIVIAQQYNEIVYVRDSHKHMNTPQDFRLQTNQYEQLCRTPERTFTV